MPATAAPAPVRAFLARHAKRKAPFRYQKPIRYFEGDLEFRIDPKNAGNHLAGEESGYDDERHLPLGYLFDLPVVVDTSRKTLPVAVLIDGRMEQVAPSFAAFEKNLTDIKPPPPGAAPGEKLLEPATAKGLPPTWGKLPLALMCDWEALAPDGKRNPFLWVNLSRSNRDRYYAKVREGLPARGWESATSPFDRGTGQFLDVAWFQHTPVVTPRVRRLLEQLPMKKVEFLPLRVSIKGKKGEYFMINPTWRIDCLDRKRSGFGLEYSSSNFPTPAKLVLKAKSVPTEAHLFRIADAPEAVVASAAVIELLRPEKLSGLQLQPLSAWTRSW